LVEATTLPPVSPATQRDADGQEIETRSFEPSTLEIAHERGPSAAADAGEARWRRSIPPIRSVLSEIRFEVRSRDTRAGKYTVEPL
jgi:hypothetical protein